MSRQIKLFDTTLRDGEQTAGVNFNLHEKVQIAKQLEKLGVDIIEAGFAITSKGDFNAIHAVSEHIHDAVVASLCRCREVDIDTAFRALQRAVSPRLHLVLATSDIHLKHKLKITREQCVEQVDKMVRYAKHYMSDVQFSLEDATRTAPEFIYRVVDTAIKAGATTINIPDTVGYIQPFEFAKLIEDIRANVPDIDKAELAVHCHNDLGQAVANTLAAIKAGAVQAEVAINGLGERAGNCALEEVVMALRTRNDYYDVRYNLDTTQIMRTSKLISVISGMEVAPTKPIVGKNAFAHESGIHQHGVLAEPTTYEIMEPSSIGRSQNIIALGKLSGRHAFEQNAQALGYDLDTDELDVAFEKFKKLADKKKEIHDDDIEAILGEKTSVVPEIYSLISFQFASGNNMISTATIELERDGVSTTEAAVGDGPVDAAFKAISRICGLELHIIDYSLRGVTQGQDALGSVSVTTQYATKHVKGIGISTDIIEASVRAYLNCINRILSNMGEYR
ncbi:MAG: 2-isopropylmalate synthase [Clostridia bacterium]|nr:2-isopropylmalate synthase [Clostridia bacterium]